MLATTSTSLLRSGLALAQRNSCLSQPANLVSHRAVLLASSCLYLHKAASQVATALPPSSRHLHSSRHTHSSLRTTRRKLPAAPLATSLCRNISLSPATRLSTSASVSQATRRSSSSRPTERSDAEKDAMAAAEISREQQAVHADLAPLDWNTFFQLRKTRRRVQLVFSVSGGLSGSLAGGLVLGSGVAEPITSLVPLDPFLTLGLMTFGFATLGWLVGPSIGNAVFYTWKRQYKAQMTLKETLFFARIKKNRVDPSASSAGNPVPDFYGEKISSVKDYRQWLRDQRAFNKKRVTFL